MTGLNVYVNNLIPIVLFTYARPDYLQRTLACLKDNGVPLIYAYSDGARTPDKAASVETVRRILREIDWCEVVLTERESNLGLGHSILTGVSEVFQKHDTIIVFEDDLACVPGTYAYLCEALVRYQDDPRVMSVTGWTHPRVIPREIGVQPYFDGRPECWTWGAWRRSWEGMENDASSLIAQCKAKGIDVYRYGADLYEMALEEKLRNLWAVRWSYHHIVQGGLCLRPPRSLVEHIGVDAASTNVNFDNGWGNPPLQDAPPLPQDWPEVHEHPDCPALWQSACGSHLKLSRRIRRTIGSQVKLQLAKYLK